MKKFTPHIFFIISMLLLFSCSKDDDNAHPENSLAAYEYELGLPVVTDSLIACAANNDHVHFDDLGFPISVFFYPYEGATNFRYYESMDEITDKTNTSAYFFKDMKIKNVFNGYMKRFVHPGGSKQTSGIVTFVFNEKLYVSNPIKHKRTTHPTEYSSWLATITIDKPKEPLFTWEDGMFDRNAIYFQAITTRSGKFISGTYTYEKHFQFYNLSNVVLNISDTKTIPELKSNTNYTFHMMAVSEDNWVNLFVIKNFRTN